MGGTFSKSNNEENLPQSSKQVTSAPVTHLKKTVLKKVQEENFLLRKTNSGQVESIPLPDDDYADYLNYAPFVGTIYDSEKNPLGMACLLEDGTLCTAMHVVCDAKALEQGFSFEESYHPLSSLSVLLTKNDAPLIWCKITDLIEDGSSFYGNKLGNYDLAILKLNNPPNKLLSGESEFKGFKLDDFNHWGTPYVSDPKNTVAISGPVLHQNQHEQNIACRYFSKSSNSAGNSSNYDYSATSAHPSTFGFSGMAMVGPVENEMVLYSMNSHRDKIDGYQVGVKISEYLHNKKIYGADQDFLVHRENILLFAEYHALKRVNSDKKAIRTFLNKLKEKSKKYHLDTETDIIPLQYHPLDRSIEFSDDHQYQHISISAWPGKSYFYPFIGNNRQHKVLNALQDSVNTIMLLYCQEQGINPMTLKYRNPVISLGFNIGLASDNKTKLSHVRIEGFPGEPFHIFPVNPADRNEMKNAIVIDADGFLPKEVGNIQYTSPAKTNNNKKAKN